MGGPAAGEESVVTKGALAGRGDGILVGPAAGRRMRSPSLAQFTPAATKLSTGRRRRGAGVRSGDADVRARLTDKPITGSNVRLFHPKADHHETHVPTLRRQAQAHARFSRPDEERGRPQGSLRAPREGPRPARALIDRRPAAMLRGSRRWGSRRSGSRARAHSRPCFAPDGAARANSCSWSARPRRVTSAASASCIGRKALPLAVDRNRVRRLLRVRLDASATRDRALRPRAPPEEARGARRVSADRGRSRSGCCRSLAANRESP